VWARSTPDLPDRDPSRCPTPDLHDRDQRNLADGLPGRDLRRLGRDDQGQADTLEDLADDRPIPPLMLKPRLVKLIRH